MSAPLILLLVLILVVIFVLPTIGLYLLFKKAGEAGWKGLIPIYNSFVMLQISDRPWYWGLLQFVPVIGLFYSLAISIEFIKVFGKARFYQHVLLILSAGLYFLYVGLKASDKFAPDEKDNNLRSSAWGWIGAGLVVIFLITLARTFIYESYSIPTTSMGRTLLPNDYLFVSKWSYGPRIPNTPLSFPYLPGLVPVVFKDVYAKSPSLSYSRWFRHPVGRGDVMVFNFPAGDTVINLPSYQTMRPYYDVIRELGRGNIDSGRQLLLDNPDQYPLVIRPVDKRENYIKRCVAIPGDTLQIRDETLYIDGKAQDFPPESETDCRITTNGRPLDEDNMQEEYGVDINNADEFRLTENVNQFHALLTWNAREKMLKDGIARSITPEIDSSEDVFPYDRIHKWTRDNYGPIWIPQKGATLELTPENYSVYERAIRVYEGNKLEIRDGKIFLNDRAENKYTFKMDYYWVMGDSRHGSQDSRYWGFVPEDHVIGKAWLIWWSWGKKVRWDRIFKEIE